MGFEAIAPRALSLDFARPRSFPPMPRVFSLGSRAIVLNRARPALRAAAAQSAGEHPSDSPRLPYFMGAKSGLGPIRGSCTRPLSHRGAVP
jgi:hypothetical protein